MSIKQDYTHKPLLNDNAKEIIAGSLAGVAQVLTGQPFDIVKVRMQSMAKPLGMI